ncbi:biotin-dependent carboxylase uncharacterized domain-containing protein [Marinobacter segnicrescens]|uniref:Biotin-dependent carboxylase uncharacterized domain-containing protein n=1 Tax=Marinobacter segnicrescens TaxID=430453 RepID=A0A1I0D3I5_9GAMM|nr:biotin-dependent carboxyltransferase family protein [Marinobacter segnicrescens]SET26485.1 biotin-dependent carboxylase uncharacterized domain-containing protein [Marinobacter segnicrescens]
MTGLRIENPGPRSTVQDGGRTGFQHQGLSPGGAADLRAWRWANHLLGNPPDAACVEITLGGFAAEAEGDLLLAVTGASGAVHVNGKPVPEWGVFSMLPGDRLQLGAPGHGLLTYLAVAGGWRTRSFLGSRSTVAREGLRELRALRCGDLLPAQPIRHEAASDTIRRRQVPEQWRSQPAQPDKPLKLIPGPDRSQFKPTDLARLVLSDYRVSGLSDRMGYRLEGPALCSPGGVTSRAVNCGTVQIPGDGKPMVMLNDRQTIGGYTVPGTVPRLDCSRLAQCRPGDVIRFTWADVAECQAERMVFEEQMNSMSWDQEGRLVRRRG